MPFAKRYFRVLKKRFPIFQHHPDLVYLDSAATAQKVDTVLETTHRLYEREYATVHRGSYHMSVHMSDRYHRARLCAQRFVRAAKVEEIIFTKGTTSAIHLVAESFARPRLQKGDVILLSQAEHHANLVPWQMVAKKTGATLSWIPLLPNGELAWDPSLLHPSVKIVSLAHVSNVTGTIHPIEEIAAACRLKKIPCIVDGAQAAPHIPIDVERLGCDFYAFSLHKCYGPTGVGILYGKYGHLLSMEPLEGGGDMVTQVGWEKSLYQDPPLRFEAGTPNIAGILALEPALRFLQDEVGFSLIEKQGKDALAFLREGLSTIPRIEILGDAKNKIPLVTFSLPGVHPLDIATYLDLSNIAVRSGHMCAQRVLSCFGKTHAVRVSFGIYNTIEDGEKFLSSLREVSSR